MQCTVLVMAVGALLSLASAGEDFPPEAQMVTFQTFQLINPTIQEDWTDHMQEVAGAFTECSAVYEREGHWVVTGKRAPNGDRIGALIDHVPHVVTGRFEQDAIAEEIFRKWISTSPYREQITIAKHYGCSIAPSCAPPVRGDLEARHGYAVIGCSFYPSCERDGCVAAAPEPTLPPRPRVYARAFTPEQYSVSEDFMFGKQWDRSHTLENLSGMETSCQMIEKKPWLFSAAINQARQSGLDVYGKSGSAVNRGSTEQAIVEILRQIQGEEQREGGRGLQFGCSVLPDCDSRNQMYVVVSCIFSNTELRA